MFNIKNNILNNEIHIYWTNTSIYKKYIFHVASTLSNTEIEIAGKYKFKRDKERYLISRYLLKKILSGYTDIPANNIIIKNSFYGKPEIENELKIKFNLSHSGDKIVFAFTLNNEIGIDIEKIEFSVNHMEIAENYFSEDEIFLLKKQKEDIVNNFYYIWTRKEALLKAIGVGMLPDLKKISAIKNYFLPDLELKEINLNKEKVWYIESIDIDNSYKTSIAYKRQTKNIMIKEIIL